jgi:NhaA family Na+:H+ antiporter
VQHHFQPLDRREPTRRWVSDERLRAILDRVVAYPADHWSGDTEDRKALMLAEIAARETIAELSFNR